MKFKELLESYEGILDFPCTFQLNNGEIIICYCDEEHKTCIHVHDDFVLVEHLKKDDKGVLCQTMIKHVPLWNIVSFDFSDIKIE